MLFRSAAWDSSGALVVTVADDRAVIVWDASSWRPLAVHAGHVKVVNQALFARDGEHLYSVGHDGALFVWRMWRDQGPLDDLGARACRAGLTVNEGAVVPATAGDCAGTRVVHVE